MDLEALRLARAKALFARMESLEPYDADWRWNSLSTKDQTPYIDLARIIGPADAALGVVSVPVEVTKHLDMLEAGMDAIAVKFGYDATHCAELALIVFKAMLAASPLREKSDE